MISTPREDPDPRLLQATDPVSGTLKQVSRTLFADEIAEANITRDCEELREVTL